MIAREQQNNQLRSDQINSHILTAKISDHYPIVHNNVLFWNVMMQCKGRGNGFNNGFGMVESDQQYTQRLEKVANVIAGVCLISPNIEVISLCEGPIGDKEKTFYNYLKNYTHIKDRFLKDGDFYRPNHGGNSQLKAEAGLSKEPKTKEQRIVSKL
jgi:hypothetical protein